MTDQDYRQAIVGALKKLDELRKQRDEIDVDIDKLTQLIHANVNMLPEEQQEGVRMGIEMIEETHNVRYATLSDAIRTILKSAKRNEWQTAAQVRDKLVKSGFDFNKYVSNPLASVSTALRRMKSDPSIEDTLIAGVTAYRWIHTESTVLDALRGFSVPAFDFSKGLNEAMAQVRETSEAIKTRTKKG